MGRIAPEALPHCRVPVPEQQWSVYLAVASTRTYLERRSGTYCRPITVSGMFFNCSPVRQKNGPFIKILFYEKGISTRKSRGQTKNKWVNLYVGPTVQSFFSSSTMKLNIPWKCPIRTTQQLNAKTTIIFCFPTSPLSPPPASFPENIIFSFRLALLSFLH